MTDAEINELLERFVPEIRSAFLAAIADVSDRALISEMAAAIQSGDAVGAFRALGMDEAALRPVIATVERAFEQGGITTANGFPRRMDTPGGRIVFRFDPRDSRAERYLRDESSKLVTRIMEDTRVNIQSRMFEGTRAGRNPRSTALDIVGRVDPLTGRRSGGVVGLTPQQERAVVRAREELANLDPAYFNRKRRNGRFDRLVNNAIKDGKPLSASEIDKLANLYSDSLLQLRGENIARSEALASLNRSELEATQQAAARGAIDESATKRVWDSAGDKRTRENHRIMDGQEVGLDEPFVSPSGSRLMHPGDSSLGAEGEDVINCRCRVRLKVDWFKNAKQIYEAGLK